MVVASLQNHKLSIKFNKHLAGQPLGHSIVPSASRLTWLFSCSLLTSQLYRSRFFSKPICRQPPMPPPKPKPKCAARDQLRKHLAELCVKGHVFCLSRRWQRLRLVITSSTMFKFSGLARVLIRSKLIYSWLGCKAFETSQSEDFAVLHVHVFSFSCGYASGCKAFKSENS